VRSRKLEREGIIPFAVDVIFVIIRCYAIKAVENTFCILGRVQYWMWLDLMSTVLGKPDMLVFLLSMIVMSYWFLHILSNASSYLPVMCCFGVELYIIWDLFVVAFLWFFECVLHLFMDCVVSLYWHQVAEAFFWGWVCGHLV
jgi:hypothetical protein